MWRSKYERKQISTDLGQFLFIYITRPERSRYQLLGLRRMENMLSIEVIWQDPDMVELGANVANNHFSGRTEVYTTYECLSELLGSIKGFPKSVSDVVELEAGEKDSYSYAGIKYYCFSSSGHTALRAEIGADIVQIMEELVGEKII